LRVQISPSRLLLAVAAPFGAAFAQASQAVTLRLDNDTFNFWKTPGNRPDEEYTSGVHLIYEGGGAPWWARSFAKAYRGCTPDLEACRARRFEFGQDIYTPRRTRDQLTPAPGSRPNAGWLYIDESARILRSARSDEFSVAIGVTGEPALGQLTQRVAHAFAPSFNRPMDWAEQIGFEPGLIVRYEHTRRITAGRARNASFDLLPHAGIALGNVTTAAEAGLRARAGVHLRHPWLPTGVDAPVEFAVSVGASARGVARDLFLDGSTFGSGPRVGHKPFTHSSEWSVTLRAKWLTLSYGAVTESRTYEGGPASHTWSSMVAGVSFVR